MNGVATRYELVLAADSTAVREARDGDARAAIGFGLDAALVEDVRLCVSEMVTNVVRHAYDDGEGPVEIVVSPLRPGVLVVVRDRGKGIRASRTSSAVGGFGIPIVERLSDRYAFGPGRDDGTELRMEFGTRPRNTVA
jgi:anti-sigma regulatory factor (Ser/Thr protein kinase)